MRQRIKPAVITAKPTGELIRRGVNIVYRKKVSVIDRIEQIKRELGMTQSDYRDFQLSRLCNQYLSH